MASFSSAQAGPSSLPAAPSILSIHTPTTSFALVHSFTQDSLQTLYDKLSRKHSTEFDGDRVGPGWLKYEYNDAIWNLDDESDYTIFSWRQQQQQNNGLLTPTTATSSLGPTLHIRHPQQPLPGPSDYRNASFYLFKPSPAWDTLSSSSRAKSKRSTASKNGSMKSRGAVEHDDGVPKFKKEFDKFHSENGVRTVIGSFGHVKDVRMLLRKGYRHVYVSRKFALRHGFVGKETVPGHSYTGLLNIGKWPITLNSATPTGSLIHGGRGEVVEPQVTEMMVYLSEEPHFDIVLGRSFFDKRQIKTDPGDLTDVVCLDTGEKVHCELVILKDGKGEFVTVT
ncbi:hypothetical protein DL96DRAFT_1465377 [Flagelloscypha sp. PMI_526]|nr:hypothetical protein DL96DRAFT_1465377 [Flagelloscypha sp. PMI_526]